MNIQEDYVSFETAKFLKEKGFDEVCYRIYDTKEEELLGTDGIEFQNHEADEETITAPTLQMAMKWLREVYKIYIDIETCYTYFIKNKSFRVTGYEFSVHSKYDSCYEDYRTCNSYEQACEEAIKYCLENLI